MVASECHRLRDFFIYMITEQVSEIATSTCPYEAPFFAIKAA